jgi:EAL domain-containing protein (putative c-di-GMP-specific phosphodiesterase class I)/CheY-like chemotaxis protein
MHLVVLDDEAGIANLVARVAKKLGWSAEAATSPSSFHLKFSLRTPDLVILDLQLGAADGIEQLRFLGKQAYRGLIVLMSGVDWRVLVAAQQVGQSLGLSMMALLQKPVRGAQLREVLADAASRLQTRGANASQEAGKRNPANRTQAQAIEQLTSADVDQALTAGTMSLVFQPVISASSREVIRFEALSRWQHPVLGMVPPDHFVPLAEEDEGVIDRLTMWVAREAAVHHKRLFGANMAVPISINVSARNIQHLDFPDRVVALLLDEDVEAGALIFEITESVAMANASFTADILARLRLKGFRLAMDDFGTGFSSLKALRQMPFSELKIDKSFVIDMTTSRDASVIVKSVIDLGRSMGLEIIAEGVETEEVAQALTDLGASGLQGYHFARPMPIDQTIEWLRERRQTGAVSTSRAS